MKKVLATLVITAISLSGCHNHKNHDHEGHNHGAESAEHIEAEHGHAHEHEAEAESHGAHGEIILSPEMAARAGVVSETIERGGFRAAVRCSGIILPSGSSETQIVAKTSGILYWEGGTPALGTMVKNKESIANISANGMVAGDAAAQAAINYEAALKDYERAKQLLEDKIISRREFNRIEADYLIAKNAVSDASTEGGMAVKSSLDGYISAVLKRQGEYVSAGESIASVTKDYKLRLQAELPERYLSLRNEISDANFKLSYEDKLFNIKDMNGRILSTARTLDRSSAYLPITFEFNNPGNIISGSYAEIWLLTELRGNVISVPESALTEEQGEFFVYEKLDEECYRKLAVKTGERNGEYVEILSGLHGGESIVTRGAYQVKLASASVIPGHTHNH